MSANQHKHLVPSAVTQWNGLRKEESQDIVFSPLFLQLLPDFADCGLEHCLKMLRLPLKALPTNVVGRLNSFTAVCTGSTQLLKTGFPRSIQNPYFSTTHVNRTCSGKRSSLRKFPPDWSMQATSQAAVPSNLLASCSASNALWVFKLLVLYHSGWSPSSSVKLPEQLQVGRDSSPTGERGGTLVQYT